MRLTIVYGTRPESVKLAPVVTALRAAGSIPTLIQTGQHTDLLRGTPAEDVMRPDVSLGLAARPDPRVYVAVVEAALRARWAPEHPDIVVVQGDTASAYAGAFAAQALGIYVAHIEAGIRSGDKTDPWPEEQFRLWIDEIAVRGYCATSENQATIVREMETGPVRRCPCEIDDRFPVTGNPGIDALYAHTQPLSYPQKMQGRVLITLHRRESFGEPFTRMVTGLTAVAQRYPSLEFLWPTHPNPNVQEHIPAHQYLAPNFLLLPPLATIPFARMLAASRCVITDSGGVQEEAAALGVPCIVARDKTDRPESVSIGLAKVAGRTSEGILQGLDWALGFQARCTPSDCFGDGHAAERIVGHLLG